MAVGAGDQERLAAARADYRVVLAEWNDNLNRNLALVETYFGTPVRRVMSGQIYESFATLGRGLEEIVKMAAAASDGAVEVPRFGHRITRLSRDVYALNLQMLRLLREDSIGRAAPQEVSWAAPQEIATDGTAPVLQIGDQGREVRRLQRALRRAGENIRIDGRFRQETWKALCSLQRSRGLMLTASRGREPGPRCRRCTDAVAAPGIGKRFRCRTPADPDPAGTRPLGRLTTSGHGRVRRHHLCSGSGFPALEQHHRRRARRRPDMDLSDRRHRQPLNRRRTRARYR